MQEWGSLKRRLQNAPEFSPVASRNLRNQAVSKVVVEAGRFLPIAAAAHILTALRRRTTAHGETFS
jgi:hypothetical protein